MKKSICLLISMLFVGLHSNPVSAAETKTVEQTIPIAPSLRVNGNCNRDSVSLTYRLAVGDLFSNIHHVKRGMLKTEEPVIIAGFEYDKPWTRDAAINVWNGGGLLCPTIAKNTLLAQMDMVDGKMEIVGQYWDKIILTVGIWNYYLYTGDKEFLEYAYPAVVNTIARCEKEEFNTKLGLFRGAAVYGDGVAAYPIHYATNSKGEGDLFSGIESWPENNPDRKVKTGFGIPMMALSTNSVYYGAYQIIGKIEKALGLKVQPVWEQKANKLREAINTQFWNEKIGSYNYLTDDYFGNCNYQEGMGLAYAILFGVPNQEQIQSILKSVVITPQGIAAVYPSFDRYRNEETDSYGRHSGTVWPHVQGFWADAALKSGSRELFDKEFNALIRNAMRDTYFAEIYHPTTGLPYGGLQEPKLGSAEEWFVSLRQTWSATAYIRMTLSGICGMEFSEEGVTFSPYLTKSMDTVELTGVQYRKARINLKISGQGQRVVSCKINGVESKPFVSANAKGVQLIEIVMSE